MLWCFILGVIVGFFFGYKVAHQCKCEEEAKKAEIQKMEETLPEVVKEAEEIEESHRKATPKKRTKKADK